MPDTDPTHAAAALAAQLLTATVERHERLLYGNGDPGLKGKVDALDNFCAELREERKEARQERRRVLTGVIVGIILQAIGLIYALGAHLGEVK